MNEQPLTIPDGPQGGKPANSLHITSGIMMLGKTKAKNEELKLHQVKETSTKPH